MKEQQVKDLFQNADTMEDYRMIYALNPNLEDEILEIGKEKGIVLPVDKELSEMELNMVVGGLGLKQGVVFTLATLMATSSIAGPACQVIKQTATTRNETGIQVIYNVDQTQKSDKKRETATKKALTKESATAQAQTKTATQSTASNQNAINDYGLKNDKYEQDATYDTTEADKKSLENEVLQQDTASNQTAADSISLDLLEQDTTNNQDLTDRKNLENEVLWGGKEKDDFNNPETLENTSESASDKDNGSQTPNAEEDPIATDDQTDTTSTNTTTGQLDTDIQRGGEVADAQEKSESKKKKSGKNYWADMEIKMELFAKGFLKNWSSVIGYNKLGPKWYGLMKDAFVIFSDIDKMGMSGKKTDANAPIMAMLGEVMNAIYKSTAEIINQNNKNTFKIVSVIEDEFIKTDKKIEAINLNSAVQSFTSTLQSFLKTFCANEDVLTHMNQLANDDLDVAYKYYTQNYNTIQNSLKSIYTTKNCEEKRGLAEIFDYISSAMFGKDFNDNDVAVVNGQSISMFEVYRKAVSANKGYVFDNQSINECEAFLNDTLRKYVSAYTLITFLVQYEINNTTEKMTEALYERILNAGELNDEYDKYLEEGVKIDGTFYTFYNEYLEYLFDGDDDSPIDQQGVIARYGSQLTRAETDLKNLEKSFQNGMKAIKAEAARIAFIKANPDIYFNGKTAYKVDHVINPNDYTLPNGTDLDEDGNFLEISEKDYDIIYYGFHADAKVNKAESNKTGAKTDLDRYEAAKKKFNEWREALSKKYSEENNTTFTKEEPIMLSNSDISALCKHYQQNVSANGGLQFDGIYVGSEDIKISNLSKFHREIFRAMFLWHEITDGLDFERGINIEKTFNYITAKDTKEVSKESISIDVDFWEYSWKNFNNETSDKVFAQLKNVTQDYVTAMQKAIQEALE